MTLGIWPDYAFLSTSAMSFSGGYLKSRRREITNHPCSEFIFWIVSLFTRKRADLSHTLRFSPLTGIWWNGESLVTIRPRGRRKMMTSSTSESLTSVGSSRNTGNWGEFRANELISDSRSELIIVCTDKMCFCYWSLLVGIIAWTVVRMCPSFHGFKSRKEVIVNHKSFMISTVDQLYSS